MEYELHLYHNILLLSENNYYKGDYWAIEIDKCRVSLEQLGNSFKPSGWVESYVINAYCRKLFRDNHPRTSQRHYFFHTAAEYFLEKWRTEVGRLSFKDKVLRSFHGAGKARRLELSNELFFPTLHEDHWFVFLVDLKARQFIFLDSKYAENSEYHTNIKNMMITNFIKAWRDANLRNMRFNQYQTAYPVLPKQVGSDDCGIFTINKMQNYRARNPLQTVFQSKDVPDARVRLAVDLLFSTHNEIDEAKTLVKDL
ncbi:uncharacterized protein LOC125523872 [Triticum urartu]|uniref:uncharacterized protein LOC125523872 n=1 Tax=Triticum urartu TaxID=4572 RepID=UPI002043FD08|nr:uncharacterized protein LOC125523872 [Triticum urartu]